MGSNPKTKLVVASVCSLLLVAMVVALIFTGGNKTESEGDVTTSKKAVDTLCQNTDYKQVCVETLEAGGETTDSKELIERAFRATIASLKEASQNSTFLESLNKDPRAKAALESCKELADRAASDLERSMAKFQEIDLMNNMDGLLSDMKIWLSGAITYQETCLDGFEGVEGDAGEQMRGYLTKGMQMTSNGLAMVNEVSSIFDPSTVAGLFGTSRRLLQKSATPDWVDSRRRLAEAPASEIKPDVVVAKDGSGDCTTINEALDRVPIQSTTTFVLYVKEGVYEEHVFINSSMTNLLMMGDGPTKTKITGRLNFIDGTGTYRTATVAVQGDYFTAKDIGFENSAGAEKHQAVALRVSADLALFVNCQMDGYQDTLYAHTYRQFYKDCVISGTIDFIFGDAASVFQGCTFVVRKPLSNQDCIVTAQGRKDIRQPTGIVAQNCSFVADPEYYPLKDTNKAYLGRPWKEYSRTIIMESFLDDLIQPAGWLPWMGDFALNTLFYTEFNNRGPASSKVNREKWAGVKELPARRVLRFTVDRFIDGKLWIPARNVAYEGGFTFNVPESDPTVTYSAVEPEENLDMGVDSMRHKSAFIAKNATAPASSPSSAVEPSVVSPPAPVTPVTDATAPAVEEPISDDEESSGEEYGPEEPIPEEPKESSHEEPKADEPKPKDCGLFGLGCLFSWFHL